MEQDAQGNGHSSELPEFKEHLDSTLRHWVSTLGGPAWSQEMGSIILMGLLQLRIFCDSMKYEARGVWLNLTKRQASKRK